MDGGEIGSSIDLSLYLQGRTLKGYAVRIYLHMYFSILFIYCQSKERERGSTEGRRRLGTKKKKDYESRARRTTTGGIYQKLVFVFSLFIFLFRKK